jgi:hypothetical protein
LTSMPLATDQMLPCPLWARSAVVLADTKR